MKDQTMEVLDFGRKNAETKRVRPWRSVSFSVQSV